MSTLEQLIRFESAHSRLAFRRDIYGAGQDAEAVIDCLALANADTSARRYLFLGVDDSGDAGATAITPGARGRPLQRRPCARHAIDKEAARA